MPSSVVSCEIHEDDVKLTWAYLKRKGQLGTLGVLLLTFFMVYVNVSASIPFLATVLEKRGVSETWRSVTFSAQPTGMVIAQFFTHWSTRRYGNKLVYAFGTIVSVIANSVYAFSERVASSNNDLVLTIIVTRLVGGFGQGLAEAPVLNFYHYIFPHVYGQILGLSEGMVGLGYIFGPLIGGLFYELAGFETPVLLVTLPLALFPVLLYYFLRDVSEDAWLRGQTHETGEEEAADDEDCLFDEAERSLVRSVKSVRSTRSCRDRSCDGDGVETDGCTDSVSDIRTPQQQPLPASIPVPVPIATPGSTSLQLSHAPTELFVGSSGRDPDHLRTKHATPTTVCGISPDTASNLGCGLHPSSLSDHPHGTPAHAPAPSPDVRPQPHGQSPNTKPPAPPPQSQPLPLPHPRPFSSPSSVTFAERTPSCEVLKMPSAINTSMSDESDAPDEERSTLSKRATLVTAGVGMFSVYSAIGAQGPLQTVYLADNFGYSNLVTGLIFSGNGLVYWLVASYCGRITDRIARSVTRGETAYPDTRPFLVGPTLLCLFNLLCGPVPGIDFYNVGNQIAIIVGILGCNIAAAFSLICGMGLLTLSTETSIASAVFCFSLNLGLAVGPVWGALVQAGWGYRWAMTSFSIWHAAYIAVAIPLLIHLNPLRSDRPVADKKLTVLTNKKRGLAPFTIGALKQPKHERERPTLDE
ncbi:hypothetical protein DIPPA_34871 [Diplonema papillatum]|nr:hypothetical protein DIPPA_34871 [Diplonema papillatum]|eukprot:gene9281-14380_t